MGKRLDEAGYKYPYDPTTGAKTWKPVTTSCGCCGAVPGSALQVYARCSYRCRFDPDFRVDHSGFVS